MAVNSKLVAKFEAEESSQRLAVLIDADNAQVSVIEGLLAEVARFGEATVKRIYIDAMDLLYTRRFDGFCLVSSDSDFTGLALRIREEGVDSVWLWGAENTRVIP